MQNNNNYYHLFSIINKHKYMEPENGQSPKKERRKEEKKSDPKS